MPSINYRRPSVSRCTESQRAASILSPSTSLPIHENHSHQTSCAFVGLPDPQPSILNPFAYCSRVDRDLAGGQWTRFLARPGGSQRRRRHHPVCRQRHHSALFGHQITHSLNVQGPGPSALVVNANHVDRAFVTSGSSTTMISGMTITNGFVVGAPGAAGGIGQNGAAGGDASGGAIYDGGNSLTLSNCWLVGNTAQGGPGGYGWRESSPALVYTGQRRRWRCGCRRSGLLCEQLSIDRGQLLVFRQPRRWRRGRCRRHQLQSGCN